MVTHLCEYAQTEKYPCTLSLSCSVCVSTVSSGHYMILIVCSVIHTDPWEYTAICCAKVNAQILDSNWFKFSQTNKCICSEDHRMLKGDVTLLSPHISLDSGLSSTEHGVPLLERTQTKPVDNMSRPGNESRTLSEVAWVTGKRDNGRKSRNVRNTLLLINGINMLLYKSIYYICREL